MAEKIKEQHEKNPKQVKKANPSQTAKSPLGEKFDARKMVIYSEIMNPKYKD